jgi:hypothetical protein
VISHNKVGDKVSIIQFFLEKILFQKILIFTKIALKRYFANLAQCRTDLQNFVKLCVFTFFVNKC